MGRNALFITLLIIFDGAAVAWAAWEVWTIRPGKQDHEPAPPKPASPEASGHAEGEHSANDR